MLAAASPNRPHNPFTMPSSSDSSSDSTKPSQDDKQAAPLPEAYKSFLNSISNKITRYLDEGDDAASQPSAGRTCAACGLPRDPDGRHEKSSTNDVRKCCQCR